MQTRVDTCTGYLFNPRALVSEAIPDLCPLNRPTSTIPRLQSILRKRRKVQLNMHYGDEEADLELRQVAAGGRPPSSRELLQQEPDWTLQDIGELVYQGQRKRVELVRWCSLLSERGRAERIDIIARVLFPTAFVLFNIAYWSVYLGEDPNFPSEPSDALKPL